MSGDYMNCIDLDAIKTDLERQMDRNNPNWSWNNETACYDLLEYLAKFPVIDPVKHGEWMHKENSPWNFFVCSVCGAEHIATFGKEDNYCSCCGAKMDGDKNG